MPRAQKVREDKPTEATDACFLGSADAQSTDMAQCGQLYPHYGTTRTAAGAPLVNNILKCQLRPLRRGDYAGITFSDDQYKQLQQAFPTGVCDYAKPGVGQQRATPWMTLENGPGGEPLGPAPASAPLCASRRSVVFHLPRGARRVRVRVAGKPRRLRGKRRLNGNRRRQPHAQARLHDRRYTRRSTLRACPQRR